LQPQSVKGEFMNEKLGRRNLLSVGLAVMGGLVASRSVSASVICAETAPQPRGPFYPGETEIEPVNDLTRMHPSSPIAQGQLIEVVGSVRDQNCAPVAGVNVEIWQACATGRYNHEGDPNSAELDPHFRYWGETFTDKNGEYRFLSIKPGAYPAADAWDRPPHIHFRVAKRGYTELITQMYFAGEPLNDLDLILQRVPPGLRSNVIVDFNEKPDSPEILLGRFDINIEKLM
jgi:protocatechuate 3,4-dioxygenase, beta subunit